LICAWRDNLPSSSGKMDLSVSSEERHDDIAGLEWQF
jgi:hypothetical protein